MSGNQFWLFTVHLKLNEHLLENLSIWEWNGMEWNVQKEISGLDGVSYHCLFYLFSSFSVSFFFPFLKILFIFSSIYIVYLNHEIKFTNIFCLFFLVASCVLQDLSSWGGIEPKTPAVEMQDLKHWTTRKVPTFLILFHYLFWKQYLM